MAGTVTSDLSTIDNCDVVGDWTAWGGSGLGVDEEMMIEGVGCLGVKAKVGEGIIYNIIAEVDLSTTLLYAWLLASALGKLENKADGGLQIRLGTDGDNYRTWYVGGKDAYRGGWECFCIKPTEAGSISDVGTYDYSAVTYIAIVFKCTSTSVKNVNFFDCIRYGTGLTLYAGTSGSPASLADFLTSETANRWGVIYNYEGVFYMQGKIRFGSLTEATDTYIKILSENIVFIDRIVPSGFYEVILQGKAGQTTEIYFGIKSGDKGISGCIFKSSGTAKFKVTATNADITKFGFYGCTFLNASTITFPSYSPDKEALNCIFEECAEVLADTCIVKYSKFICSPAEAVRIISASHNISNCDFISCNRGFHTTTTDTLSFNALSFSGCTYDGYNTSGSSVTVNYDQYCSPPPSSYDPAGDSITFQTSVTLIVRHVKTGNEPTEHVRCYIRLKNSPFTEIMNKDADVADDQNPTYYKASQSYNQTGVVVVVRAREKGYLPFEIELTIPSGGLDVTAVWIADPNYQP